MAGPRVQTIFARRTVSKLADQRLTRAIRTGTRSGSRQDLTHPTYARSRKRARAVGNHFPTDLEPAFATTSAAMQSTCTAAKRSPR